MKNRSDFVFAEEDAPIITSVGITRVQGEPALATVISKGAEVLQMKLERVEGALWTAMRKKMARLVVGNLR